MNTLKISNEGTTLKHYSNVYKGIMVFENNWYLLFVDHNDFANLISQVTNAGITLKPNKKPHISVIKNENPSDNVQDFGVKFVGDNIEYKFANIIRNENGLHVWIDCYSETLCKIREHFGLPTLKRADDNKYLVNFHCTMGKLKIPNIPNIRPQLRLSKASHIDVETGMQHL